MISCLWKQVSQKRSKLHLGGYGNQCNKECSSVSFPTETGSPPCHSPHANESSDRAVPIASSVAQYLLLHCVRMSCLQIFFLTWRGSKNCKEHRINLLPWVQPGKELLSRAGASNIQPMGQIHHSQTFPPACRAPGEPGNLGVKSVRGSACWRIWDYRDPLSMAAGGRGASEGCAHTASLVPQPFALPLSRLTAPPLPV